MRVLLAGATGVIGSRLVPLLVAAGHDVVGLTRSPGKAAALVASGATAVVADVFDTDALIAAAVDARPDVVLDQLTDLPDDAASIGDFAARNARIRREGTANLLAAATAAGTARFVAQSVAWTLPGDGAVAADEMERAVLGFGGVVARYGRFYGPGTYYPETPPDPPRVHIDEAARRTLPALTMPSGVLTIVEE